ncbi:helix-turn-helix transcriptional regulator [Atlantibacter hermannii]|uniref:XRE family transcriptional regulator n=1 Tax=Atlantibacter hermannii TaxID=565 RepID=UPI0028A6788E|nr:helix-turn-helix transcriptional regulator [Atlantibacter hermannii]
MKTFAERLNAAMSAAGISQGQLAEKVGISQPAIQKMTSGKTSGSRKMVELAHALNVRPEWLSSGNGSMRDGDQKESSVPPESEWNTVETWDDYTPLNSDEVEVPFFKDIEFACGDGRTGDEDYNGYKLRFSKSTLRRIGASTDGHGIICFPARGNSMEPNIPDGTTVAVNTEDKKIVDGKMYAISEDGWKRIKLLYRTGPETVSIRSYNSIEHPPEEKPLSKIEVIGRVFWWSVLDY